jgi:hypothetical protein
LFDRVGGLWIDGVELQTPNFADEKAPTVPLQLFMRPIDKPASHYTTKDLADIAAGLLDRIYRVKPGDAIYDATMRSCRKPRLRPAKDAGRLRVLAGV